ncbi:glycosyltransferase [Gemella sanguinis]|uniref:glycosyltransferase family 2 protein n=1 Tax=Gemella sanguinis TaxID=84135 RepID=UPI00352C9283
MQDKILSIIVPTYNIEQYIKKCIESFKKINEKYYSEFEVIVVNDGSTDNSVQLVESLMVDTALDLRIISKENGGHGSTINVGITESKGKYFKVIDGDDWIDVSSFETLLEKLKTIDIDMVISNYTEQHVYNNSKKTIDFIERIVPNIVIEGLPDRRIPMHALTYRTSILKGNNIKISEKTFYVDMEYTLLPLKYVNNYIYYNLDVYQYFLGRPDQSMNINVMKEKYEHHNRVVKRVLDLYNEIKGNKKLEEIVENALEYLINKQCLLFLMNNNKKGTYELFKYSDKCNFRYTFSKDRKTVGLLYINYKTKKIFNFIIEPIINKKVKKLGEDYVN